MFKKYLTLSLSIFLIMFFSIACDQTKDAVEKTKDAVNETAESVKETAEKAANKVGETTEKVVEGTKDAANKVVEGTKDAAGKVVEEVKDLFDSNKLVGVWKGKLADRETVLTITSSKDNNVAGKIVINLGNLTRQNVKGTFNPETRALNMQDQLKQKDQGKYNGTVSEDGKTYSGTFTILKTNDKVNFKLFKK